MKDKLKKRNKICFGAGEDSVFFVNVIFASALCNSICPIFSCKDDHFDYAGCTAAWCGFPCATCLLLAIQPYVVARGWGRGLVQVVRLDLGVVQSMGLRPWEAGDRWSKGCKSRGRMGGGSGLYVGLGFVLHGQAGSAGPVCWVRLDRIAGLACVRAGLPFSRVQLFTSLRRFHGMIPTSVVDYPSPLIKIIVNSLTLCSSIIHPSWFSVTTSSQPSFNRRSTGRVSELVDGPECPFIEKGTKAISFPDAGEASQGQAGGVS
ncbi:hypothetical protein F511_35685 [Dorcoceras hygrometricum]|uniref:Uncharacterized protein n=1 Tax=Dorcoceras hygrometricum TaxID=472368 RepID=A0A2Z7DAS6_9LAMI|nr:hypothetical protein F511_35685 [Dorcoceras hygrometricum]